MGNVFNFCIDIEYIYIYIYIIYHILKALRNIIIRQGFLIMLLFQISVLIYLSLLYTLVSFPLQFPFRLTSCNLQQVSHKSCQNLPAYK